MATANGARVDNNPDVFPYLGIRWTMDVTDGGAHQFNMVGYMDNLMGVEFGVQSSQKGYLPYAIAFEPGQETVESSHWNKFSQKPLSDGPHTFEFVWDSGTKWDFIIDGRMYANNVNLGASQSADIDGPPLFLLAEVGNPAPTGIVEYSDFQYMSMEGAWTDIPSATAYNSGGPLWPIEGNLQNPEIPPGDMWIGDDLLLGAQPPEYLWDLMT